MKKICQFSILMIFLMSLCGCNSLSRQTIYALDDDNISFSLPKRWEQVDSNENDLALTKDSADLSMNTYHQSDLDGMSAEGLLKKKIEENTATMSSYRIVKNYNRNETQDRIIYSTLYSGTKKDIETQYYASVVEFKGTHTYVYVLYEAKEMYMNYNIDDIQRILLRMKWKGEEDLVLK